MTDTDDIARLAALAEYLRDDLGTPGHNADADAIDRVLARCAEFDGIDKAIDQQCADYADLHARIQQQEETDRALRSLEAVAEAAQAYFDTREFVATQGVRATAPSEWLPTKERLRAALAALRDSRLSDRGKL